MTDDDRLIEVQGTAEHGAFSRASRWTRWSISPRPASASSSRSSARPSTRRPASERAPAHRDDEPRASSASSAACWRACDAEIVTPDEIGLELEVDEPTRPMPRTPPPRPMAYCARSGLLTVADDSGIEVAALDWGPGVRSARWGRATAARPSGSSRPSASEPTAARGWCARWPSPSLATRSRRSRYSRGVIDGAVAPRAARRAADSATTRCSSCPRACTTAELPEAEKDRISHRGRAVAAALAAARELLEGTLAHRSRTAGTFVRSLRCARRRTVGCTCGGPRAMAPPDRNRTGAPHSVSRALSTALAFLVLLAAAVAGRRARARRGAGGRRSTARSSPARWSCIPRAASRAEVSRAHGLVRRLTELGAPRTGGATWSSRPAAAPWPR